MGRGMVDEVKEILSPQQLAAALTEQEFQAEQKKELSLGRGRPTLYKPEYCDLLLEHCKKGLSFEAFAGALGVSIQTLYDWQKNHSDFLDAKTLGAGLALHFWERMGIALATGKIKGGSAAIYIFNMKNRFRWRDKLPDEPETHNVYNSVIFVKSKDAQHPIENTAPEHDIIDVELLSDLTDEELKIAEKLTQRTTKVKRIDKQS